ncbi:MAG: polysaccharide deacetylase family protein [Actinomycetia bacterium]|nr:polysaccharide deacetylase family protein [Actinomycetes bacterium]
MNSAQHLGASSLVVSLHDVAPGTAAQSKHWLSIVEWYGLRATLLVVPGPWRGGSLANDPAFAAWLRAAEERGHELALHGWEHRSVRDQAGESRNDTRRHSLMGALLARGCQEFWQLGADESERRIIAGQEVLRAAGIEARGFTPPGWLASPETLSTLRRLGFEYTTTQWSVVDLHRDREIRIAALSQRPGSALTGVAARANEQIARSRLTRRIPLRLALHPDDLGDLRLVNATKRTLAHAVRVGTRSVTYCDLVAGNVPEFEMVKLAG